MDGMPWVILGDNSVIDLTGKEHAAAGAGFAGIADDTLVTAMTTKVENNASTTIRWQDLPDQQ